MGYWTTWGTEKYLNKTMVQNPEFAASDGWTLGTGWSVAGGKLVGTTVSQYTQAFQWLSFQAGVTYNFIVNVTSALPKRVDCRITRSSDNTYVLQQLSTGINIFTLTPAVDSDHFGFSPDDVGTTDVEIESVYIATPSSSTNYIQIDFTQKEWVPRVITVFPQISGYDKNYRFFLATSDDKFIADEHFWGSTSHNPAALGDITEMTSFASGVDNYISVTVPSSTNYSKYTYAGLDYKYKDTNRWQCNSIRIYPVISGSATDFNICDIKPVVQEIANEFYGEILNLSKNITIATAASGVDPAGSNVVILDKTGLTMYKGTNQVLDIGELDLLSGAMGMWIGGDVYIGGSATDYNTNYNIKLDDTGNMYINAVGSSTNAVISIIQKDLIGYGSFLPVSFASYTSGTDVSVKGIGFKNLIKNNQAGGTSFGQYFSSYTFDQSSFVPNGNSCLLWSQSAGTIPYTVIQNMTDKDSGNFKYFQINPLGLSSSFPFIMSSNSLATINMASGSNFIGFQSPLRFYDNTYNEDNNYRLTFNTISGVGSGTISLMLASATTGIPYTFDFSNGTISINSMSGFTQYTSEPTGFVSTASSTMTFNSSTNVFTISAISSTFLVYIKGKQYAMPTTNIDLSSVIDNGANYIYFDSTGTIRHASSFWDLSNTVPVAYILYSSSSDPKSILCEERHGITMDWATHKHDHMSRGSFTTDAFTLADYTPNSDVDNDKNFSVAQGSLYDEDLLNLLPGKPDNGSWSVMYREGASGTWRWQTSVVPFVAGTYMCYNLASATGWGIASSTSGYFINMYIVAINATSLSLDQRYVAIMGQTVHSTLTAAQSETVASISFGNMPFQEMLTLWQVTYKLNASYGNTGKCVIAATPVSQQSMRSPSQISATFTSHNALSGRDASNCHPLSAILNDAGDTFTNAITFASSAGFSYLLTLPGPGATTFSSGTGDGGDYTTHNVKLSGWWGMGFYNPTTGGTYPNQISGYINFREGILDMKGDLKVNGNSVWHSGEFNPANYMPLTGGTISGNLAVTGTLVASGAVSCKTGLSSDTTLSAATGVYTPFLYSIYGTKILQTYSGSIQIGNGVDESAYTPFHVASSVGNTNAIFGQTNPIGFVSNDPHLCFNSYYNAGWKGWTGGITAGALQFESNLGHLSYWVNTSAIVNKGDALTPKFLFKIYYGGCVQIGSGTDMSAYTPFHIASSVGNTNAIFGSTNPLTIMSNDAIVAFNCYYNAGWKGYTAGTYAGRIALDSTGGRLLFGMTASSVTAGGAITQNERMIIYASGCVQVGGGTNMSAYAPFHIASASTWESSAIFGNTSPLCFTANWPTIGFNIYNKSGWKCFTSGYYGAYMYLYPDTGAFEIAISSGTGTAGSAYDAMNTRFSLAKTGILTLPVSDRSHIIGGSYPITLKSYWPTIGFNTYSDGTAFKYSTTGGCAGTITYVPTNGTFYFSGTTSSGTAGGAITGSDFMTIASAGVVAIVGIQGKTTAGYGVYGYASGTGGYATVGYDVLGLGHALLANGRVVMTNITASGSAYGTLKITNTGYVYIDTSSIQFKNNIRQNPYGLSSVMQMQSSMFNWNRDGMEDIGFIAEQVNEICPHIVGKDTDGKIATLNYDRISVLLVKAIQEQQQIIDIQKETLYNLNLKVQQMEAKLNQLLNL